MFYSASVFNLDISKWGTSVVTNMGNMFDGVYSFNVLDTSFIFLVQLNLIIYRSGILYKLPMYPIRLNGQHHLVRKCVHGNVKGFTRFTTIL
jgi:surface protein